MLAERDALGRVLGFVQNPTGTWSGPCPNCGGDAQVWSGGLSCAECRPLTMDEALTRFGAADRSSLSLRTLDSILADPSALEPPRPVVPRLAWAGRVTLAFGREKEGGKSTLASAASAAVSMGEPFLGDTTTQGSVLYLGLEEHVSDQARRLTGFRAEPSQLWILERVERPLSDLRSAVEETRPVLVVVDTLAAFVRSLALDSGDTAAWEAAVAGIGQIAREFDIAVLVLHHARKTDGEYRDSTAIGGAVDMLVKIEEGGAPDARRLTPRGRWHVDPFTVRLVEGPDGTPSGYALGDGEISLDARVLAFVARNPGASQRAVRSEVRGKSEDVRQAVLRLVRSGAVEDRGNGAASRLFSVETQGTEEEPGGNRSGTGLQNHGAVGGTRGGLSPVGGAPREPAPRTTVEDVDGLTKEVLG